LGQEDWYVLHDVQEFVMDDSHCPACGSTDVVAQTVSDRLRAADPRGHIFEVPLRVPMWSCNACKLCWQGEEAEAAKETAYRNALVMRTPTRTAA
jgi:hypothetical protein